MMNSFMQPYQDNRVAHARPRNAVQPMRCDVLEYEDRYELDLDLPGFRKEDIHISIKDSNLTVEAAHPAPDKENVPPENAGKVLRSERYAGPYARSFHIGKDLDCENVHAAYTDGVLVITLRKIRKVPATIEIQ
ncbi:MAG: Hsp20 family protein [Clostridia bacterium]|nr:Hsp20 family protein [Clostridia bacterium]